MEITVNGKTQSISGKNISITELLKKNKVEMPETVSVQLNEAFVQRENFETTLAVTNDAVDFLYFMGGGSI